MDDIYKVTSTKITTSKNGYTIFNLQLNNTIWASQLAPVLTRQQKYSTLYRIYKDNNSLNTLIGKYIDISIYKSDYGMQFYSNNSYDMVADFKKLLDDAEGKTFSTNIPIYGLLKKLNYKIDSDGSILLKPPYDFYRLINKDKSTICYQKSNKKNVLSFDNIQIIYEEFYHNKHVGAQSIDDDLEYGLTDVAIVEHYKRYHKYRSKITRQGTRDILKIGDKLSKEHINFFAKKNSEPTKILNIPDNRLVKKTSKNLVEDENWMKRLWKWADENEIPDLDWTDENGSFWQGLPRSKEMLLNLTTLKININNSECDDEESYTEIPEEIGNLINLTELEIAYVLDLPTTISNLKSLTKLSLSRIDTVPDYIGQFKDLKELILFDVTIVPDSICNLTNLTDLFIAFYSCDYTISELQSDWLERLKYKGCEIFIECDIH